MIEHVIDLGNQLKKELETSKDFEVQSYKDLLIVGIFSKTSSSIF